MIQQYTLCSIKKNGKLKWCLGSDAAVAYSSLHAFAYLLSNKYDYNFLNINADRQKQKEESEAHENGRNQRHGEFLFQVSRLPVRGDFVP